ncbi:MAG: hypothetical protein OXE94_13235 [Aestuariivita sp.]|nr:hypothetical protein [Aestuariivita sp.]MCY4204064.1 hypothetical protein [Aestuariivita sp.]MCY4290090.1 hypothetical protein [Aestuariivita sp.]MCY4347986.1 hypothetical protein [Aestuariivita sp.]
MSITEMIARKLVRIPADNSDLFNDDELSKEEKEAINEAERLADQYSDIQPEQLVISGNHLFQI